MKAFGTTLIIAILIFGLSKICFADEVSYKALPDVVKLKLDTFLKCADVSNIDSGGRDQFVFCESTVSWRPEKTELLKRCLKNHIIAYIQSNPSPEGAGKEYSVVIKCSSYPYAEIEIETTVSKAFISGIGELEP